MNLTKKSSRFDFVTTLSLLFATLLFFSVGETASQTVDNSMNEALIPAGEFLMGTDAGTNAERPVHKVWLGAFYLDRYEISNADYERVVAGFKRSRASACDQCPATKVNWYEAQAYCNRLGKRLPTEAEWEKAARGPLGWDYSFSKGPDATKGHFGRPLNSGPAAVDSLEPNGYGIHHLNGNVWEWVHDWFDKSYYQSDPVKNPSGPETGFRKAVRGGSWYNPAYYVHAGMRFALTPNVKLVSVGFRCARDP